MARKRGNGEGTIYARKDGRYEAAVSLPGGLRKRVYGRTRQEAHEKLNRELRNLALGLGPTDDKITVGRFFDRWLEEVIKPNRRPKTYSGYEQLIRLHIKPGLGKIRLSSLRPEQVQALINRKLAAGLSPRYVLYMRAVLRAGLQRALKWGLLHRNVAALVDPPAHESSEVQPLTPEELAVFREKIAGDRLEALYVFAVSTGMRQGEILGLMWHDVDLEAGQLRVRMQVQRVTGQGIQRVDVKSRKSRRGIDLPQFTVEALRAHRDRQDQERVAAGDRWREHGLVFPSSIGTPMDGSNVTHRFQKLLAKAGLPRHRFHDLRHSAATFLLLQGVPLEVVSKILGHSSLQITADLYEHLLPALRRDAADRMDALLRGRPRLSVVDASGAAG